MQMCGMQKCADISHQPNLALTPGHMNDNNAGVVCRVLPAMHGWDYLHLINLSECFSYGFLSATGKRLHILILRALDLINELLSAHFLQLPVDWDIGHNGEHYLGNDTQPPHCQLQCNAVRSSGGHSMIGN